ncbi:MAG: DciA family protein, partial [Rectinemataceae bacterium]
ADVNNGILIIETEHPGWIQLLQLRQKAILDGLETRYPELNLRSIVFRVGSATTGRNESPKPTSQAPMPLNEEDRAIVRAADTTGVEDPLLRSLLASLKATMEKPPDIDQH